jgi:hypothetical protein
MNKEDLGFMHSIGDAFSVSVLLGYFMGALPTVALVLTTIWTAIRIWEMCTVVNWRNQIRYWRGKDNEPSS